MEQIKLAQLSRLVEFFGLVLGPDYEVVLHDLTLEQPCVVAIANGQISGRTIGAPLTNVAMQLIKDRVYLRENWKINYQGVSANGRILRCSTFFLKDENERLLGLLCINFDDSRYRELSAKIYSLCHPDEFIRRSSSFFSSVDAAGRAASGSYSRSRDEAGGKKNSVLQEGSARFGEAESSAAGSAAPGEAEISAAGNAASGKTETSAAGNTAAAEAFSPESEYEQFYATIESAVSAALLSVMHGKNVPPSRLSRQEKLEVIRMLNQKGIFMLKGAVPIISQSLGCSQATIYRYISLARSQEDSGQAGK
jgi:predicted transcriptional regulator YheO